jgi:elongation factor P
MYDTSDIRKGLKVLMDGNPYNVIEFQFVKPGKGAAFTRTKFKNLLTGAVVERNIRSGEKLEPANVETRDMQFLYKEGGDLVFMDQTSYEQVTIAADMIGEAHDLMKDNLPCTVVFFNERPVDITLPTFVFLEVTASEPGVTSWASKVTSRRAALEARLEAMANRCSRTCRLMGPRRIPGAWPAKATGAPAGRPGKKMVRPPSRVIRSTGSPMSSR